MQNQEILLELAADVLPGFGAFGPDPVTCLSIPVGMTLDSVLLTIAAPHAEFINLHSAVFFDRAGKEIARKSIVASVAMSSFYAEKTPAEALELFNNGNMFHSAKEISPSMMIKLKAPVFISKIEVPNRGDINHRRSRFLTVRGFLGGACKLSFDNMDPAHMAAEMAEILRLARVKCPETLAAPERAALVARVREECLTAIAKGGPDWTIRRLTNLLPMFEAEPDMSDLSKTACARIVLCLMDIRMPALTRDLRFFAQILRSDLRIDAVRAAAIDMATQKDQPPRNLAISKHHIHFSDLIERREVYLAGLDKVIPLMTSFGVTPMLCYGTLLGAVREGDFLAHDDDVDLLYFDGSTSYDEAQDKKRAMIAAMIDAGHDIWDGGENFVVNVDGISFDLFFSWQEEDRLHLMMEKYKYRDVPAEIVLPYSEIAFHGRLYNAPANPTALLAERYGEGWSVSDPYHEWPWAITRYLSADSAEVAANKKQRAMQTRKRLDRTCLVAWGQRIGKVATTPPKNSLAIITAAIEAGFDAIELDVRMSVDGLPVLAHDAVLMGPDGNINVDTATESELSRFNLGTYQGRTETVQSLQTALTLAKGKAVMIDPRANPESIVRLRESVEAAQFDPADLLFCVYSAEEAVELVRVFPESVLMWKIGTECSKVSDASLDEAVALGMDGVMLIWPMFDEDFSGMMDRLKDRDLRVLFYLHGGLAGAGGWPTRAYKDDPEVSLQRMIDAGVDYITTTANEMPLFQKTVGR